MSLDPTQIEFLLSQRADGTLSAEEMRQVEAALAADPALRENAARYERLASLIGHVRNSGIACGAPLSDSIREAIAAELRFQMSQDMDNQLDAAAAGRLNRTLSGHLALQRDDQGLRETQALLERFAAARPVPDMGDLASRIGAAVRREPVANRR